MLASTWLLHGIHLHFPKRDRFIDKYGTHIIVGLSVDGHDVVLVRQDKSSDLAPWELKKHLYDLGYQLFTGTCNIYPKTKENKYKAPQAFNDFDPQPFPFNSVTGKDVYCNCEHTASEVTL